MKKQEGQIEVLWLNHLWKWCIKKIGIFLNFILFLNFT